MAKAINKLDDILSEFILRYYLVKIMVNEDHYSILIFFYIFSSYSIIKLYYSLIIFF